MFYNGLLIFHSYFRWIVLFGLLYNIIVSFYKNKFQRSFQIKDYLVAKSAVILFCIQAILGLCLYYLSPLVKQFYQNPSLNIHHREIRFFSIEHSLMMLLAVILSAIGLRKSKQSKNGFKVLYIWFLIAIIIILLNIPWQFSSLVHRPLFR